MANSNIDINPGGINGTGEGVVNINSKDYKSLQQAVVEHAKKQTPHERITYALLSLRFQMESYVEEVNLHNLVNTGAFLHDHLRAIGIKNKEFAAYIDIEESNLSSILRGKRKINIDLAYKLGQVFNTDPSLWLLIQSKNELLCIETEKKSEYKKYKLEDLIKKAS